MTSISSVAPTSHEGRLNAVAPERAKKLAKRLHKIAIRQQGVLRIDQLSDAQGVVAELFGLPDWHALQRQPDASPMASVPSIVQSSPSPLPFPLRDEPVWRVPDAGWTWYALHSPSGTLSVQQVAAQIRIGLMIQMRAMVTRGGCVALAVTKNDNPASMTVHLGVPSGFSLANNDDPSWATTVKIPTAWQKGTAMMNDVKTIRWMGKDNDWAVMEQATDSSVWLNGQIVLPLLQGWGAKLEMLFAKAQAWWSTLAERPGHTSLALGLNGGVAGEIRASLMVGLHDHGPIHDPVDTWNRLSRSVEMAETFKEMRSDDYEVRVSAEAWPWNATEHLALVDAYESQQTLGWDPQSTRQTSHVATIAPANAFTRKGWIDGVLHHLVQKKTHPDSPVTLTVLAPESQVQQLQAGPVALVPWDVDALRGFNPFGLPPRPGQEALDRPAPAHRHLLIAGLQAISGVYEGTGGLWSMLLDRAYALSTDGPDVSVQTLLDRLDDDTVQHMFKDATTPLGDPLIVMARKALTSLQATMLGPRQPTLPQQLALPVGGSGPMSPALTWFAMAYVHAVRSGDAWALDATVLPSLMNEQGKEALIALTSHQRRFGSLILIAHDEVITGNLAELSTLTVSNTNPTKANTMRLQACTNEGYRTRTAEWLTKTV